MLLFMFFIFFVFFFFFNDTATTEIYTLSLHDALPISVVEESPRTKARRKVFRLFVRRRAFRAEYSERGYENRSEEHTSELQSRRDLVCRLLLEKKKKQILTKIN